jgi:hypothetical protein
MTRFGVFHHDALLGLFPTYGDARDHLYAVHPHARVGRDGRCGLVDHGYAVKAVKV